jgi:hypothetical protein
MAYGSNLKRRGSISYARLVVPVELRHLMGASELLRSLHTSDRRSANVRKLPVLNEWQDKFADLQRRREMTEADDARATWDTKPANGPLMIWSMSPSPHTTMRTSCLAGQRCCHVRSQSGSSS